MPVESFGGYFGVKEVDITGFAGTVMVKIIAGDPPSGAFIMAEGFALGKIKRNLFMGKLVISNGRTSGENLVRRTVKKGGPPYQRRGKGPKIDVFVPHGYVTVVDS